MKYLYVLIAVVFSTMVSMAQREKNYIYLFDCTGSMRTNGLWDTAQSALDNNISLRATIPGTYFTVIPFGNNPYETISFSNAEYQDKKQNISGAFAKYISQAKYTNISDVLKAGFRQVNPNMDNEIYLFTDGMPNNGDSPQKVAQTISEWCASHRNARLFYVALTKGVVNPVIKQAIDACADASVVQCEDGFVPVITGVSTDVYTNLQELDNVMELTFSVPGDYNLTSAASDDLFDFKIIGNMATNGRIKVKVSPKGSLTIDQLHQILQGEEYEFPVKIQCADSRFVIVNPNVNVHVYDEVPSKLTIARGVDELQTEGVEWYGSFLWSDAAPDRKVVWDLMPVFKNELQNSRLCLKFRIGDDQTEDFNAWYNGYPVGDGDVISIVPDQPALLEVMFNHNAATGKRYFSLVPTSVNNLDILNDMPSADYKGTSLRTDYNILWNPLKTILFWLTLILLAALIIWIFILRRIFFRPIKLGRMTVTGPGTYYSSKKIKGARKIILTSRRRSQNIFSRIFTGEVRFIKADHFSPELSVIAVGGKKKVKLRAEGRPNDSWEIHPSTIFGQYDKGSLIKRTSNEKSEIEFS